MCFGMGGGGGSSAQPEPRSDKEITAIQTQQAYRKQQINNVNAYNSRFTDVVGGRLAKAGRTGFNTDIAGRMIGANDGGPTSSLKRLMGA